jgi:Fe-S oxidoreductase
MQASGQTRQKRLDWITRKIQVAGENESGKVALFVGCAPYYDALLAERIGFRATDETHAAVEMLNSVGVKPVVLPDEVCCGGDRIHAGDRDGFMALGIRNRDLLKERGVKTIVTTCDDCRYTLANRYPGRIPGWDFKVVRLADFLVERGGKLAFMPTPEVVAVQPPDPYSDPNTVESIRKILNKIPELITKEFEPGLPSTFGSWGQFDAISKRLESDYLKSAECAMAESVLVPGTRMLVRLMEGRRPGSWVETSINIRGFYGFLADRHTVAVEFTGA